MGLSAVMGAKIAEASRILVFDLNDQRLAMAKRAGRHRCLQQQGYRRGSYGQGTNSGRDRLLLDTTGNGFVIKNAIHILARPEPVF